MDRGSECVRNQVAVLGLDLGDKNLRMVEVFSARHEVADPRNRFASMNVIKILRLLPVLWLVSCATSNVISCGPDTFMVTSSGAGFDTGSVRENCFKKANDFCEERDLVMMPVAIDVQGGELGKRPPTAELTFRALRQGDPEIGRPNLEKPDAIIRIESR